MDDISNKKASALSGVITHEGPFTAQLVDEANAQGLVEILDKDRCPVYTMPRAVYDGLQSWRRGGHRWPR